MKGLDGKTAVVFGATSGIGAATAKRLCSEGCNVVLAGRRVAEGRAVVADINADQRTIFVHCDIADEAAVEHVVDQALEQYGSLDLAVNNAAAISPAPITDATDEQYATVFDTNVKGTIHCLKHEVRAMAEGTGGAIVNVNSNGGLLPVLGNALYGASKRGVTGLTQQIAYEYGAAGIRVNEIAPGATRTEMLEDWIQQAAVSGITLDDFAATNALRRISAPWEQAAAIAFLLSDEAAFITGVTLPTDGGSVLMTRAVPTAGGQAPTLPGDEIVAERARRRDSD